MAPGPDVVPGDLHAVHPVHSFFRSFILAFPKYPCLQRAVVFEMQRLLTHSRAMTLSHPSPTVNVSLKHVVGEHVVSIGLNLHGAQHSGP